MINKSIIYIAFNDTSEMEQMFHLDLTDRGDLGVIVTDTEGSQVFSSFYIDRSQVKHFVKELNHLVNE